MLLQAVSVPVFLVTEKVQVTPHPPTITKANYSFLFVPPDGDRLVFLRTARKTKGILNFMTLMRHNKYGGNVV